MENILVHAHVFYPDIWSELEECIANIAPQHYDLYVTLVEKNVALEKQIKAFNPQVTILTIDNVGFDVGPFIHVLNQVDLTQYTHIIKLHTKRNVPIGGRVAKKYDAAGNLWRSYLLSFVKTRLNFERCLAAFAKNSQLGMCAHHCLMTYKKLSKDDCYAFEQSSLLLRAMHLPMQSRRQYVGGTMFMAKAALFLPLQQLQIPLSSFEKPDGLNVRTKAHIIERLFGVLVTAQGHTIEDVFTPAADIRKIELKSFFYRLKEFFYMVRVSRRGNRTIKICCIPVRRTKV